MEGEYLTQPKLLRSGTCAFQWKDNCFFCGLDCSKINDKNDFRSVQTVDIYDSVIAMCESRTDDVALGVKSRLMLIPDLRAPDAVYHVSCYSRFSHVNVHDAAGRPIDVDKKKAFDELCSWLDVTDDELLTLSELTEKSKELVGASKPVYSEKWLQKKLEERYGDHFFIAKKCGRSNVICWRAMASYVANDKWYQERKQDVAEDSERIVIAAAKLLKNAIRDSNYDSSCYPTIDKIGKREEAFKWLPSLLQTFLDYLICPPIKKISLGHSIVQAVRPKTVISPIYSRYPLVTAGLVYNIVYNIIMYVC